AEVYWQARVYPNRYLPELAPVFPLLLVYQNGRIQPHSAYQTMLYQNLLSDFVLAERVLFEGEWRDRRLPEEDRLRLEQSLRKVQASAADAPVQAVADATLKEIFRAARASGLRLDAERCQTLLNEAQRVTGA